MVKRRITQTTPRDSPRTLVSVAEDLGKLKSNGVTPNGGDNRGTLNANAALKIGDLRCQLSSVAVMQRVARVCQRQLILVQLECGPMPNVMAALPNTGGALCSTPQSFADAQCWSAVQ